MDAAKKYKINKDDVTSRAIGDEEVVLNLENGFYYSLNEVGRGVWQLMNDGKTLGEIVKTLKETYQIPEARLEKDIDEIVQDLEKEGLIKAC